MKVLFISSLFFFMCVFNGLAQGDNLKPKEVPLIERRIVMLVNQYYILGEQVPQWQVVKLMKPYNDAYKEMKASRRWRFFSGLTAGIGVGVIIGELVNASESEGFNFGVAGIGAGIFLVAIPLSIKADRKADKAIDLYNTRQSMLGVNKNRVKLGLAIDDKGIGLKLKF